MITLYKNHKYDNKYDFVKGFGSEAERTSFFNSLEQIYFDDVNYIKDHETVVVNIPYEDLLLDGYNYLSFRNKNKTIYAFITRKEYLNQSATRLHYEIDVFTTFHFDFDIKQSFIERKNCSISEITDFDEGLALGEHKIVSDTVAITKGGKFFALFSQVKNFELVMDENGKIIDYLDIPTTRNAPMTIIDGITYPLYFVPLAEASLPSHLEDHPSLVSIVRFPDCTVTTSSALKISYIDKTDTGYTVQNIDVVYASTITSTNISGSGGTVPKASVTDFYPYTYYVLSDGETEPLIMKPQDLPSSITVQARHSLSHQPIERYFVDGYKGDTTGRTYNITNANQMTLPTATNQGMAQLQANSGMMSLQRKGMVTDNVLSGVSSVVGTAAQIAGGLALAPATGGLSLGMVGSAVANVASGANSVVSGIQSIKEADRRVKDMALTPSSISSLGNPSTRNKFDTANVRILKYSVNDTVKSKVNNFHLRYGHKFNNYGTVSHRSYKGYIKMIEPNLDGGLDNMFMNKIISVLERGVYID